MQQQQPQHPQPQQPQYAAPVQQAQPMQRSGRNWMPWLILGAIVVVVLIVLGFVFKTKIFPSKASAEKLSGYQAVFLTNGQVYFGKVSHNQSQYVYLTDIYYLQVNQALQTGGTAAAATAANQSTQLSLVKLGNELHGPADEMNINREQILFIEDLKADGQVAQAISKYQQSGGTAGAANSTPAQGTTQAPTGTPAQPTTGTTGSTTTIPTGTTPTK